jgi:hypothetical protein
MIGLFCFVLAVLASPFKSRLRLEAENAVLRHQLNVLRRRLHGRVRLTNQDRWFFIQLYRWFPSILKVLTIIRPETLVRWHRAGSVPAPFGLCGHSSSLVAILAALSPRPKIPFLADLTRRASYALCHQTLAGACVIGTDSNQASRTGDSILLERRAVVRC